METTDTESQHMTARKSKGDGQPRPTARISGGASDGEPDGVTGVKTKYQFINFAQKKNTVRSNVWSCINNKSGDELGEIQWYPLWRQWCYFPTVQAVYSAGCLADIQSFIGGLANTAMQPTPSASPRRG